MDREKMPGIDRDFGDMGEIEELLADEEPCEDREQPEGRETSEYGEEPEGGRLSGWIPESLLKTGLVRPSDGLLAAFFVPVIILVVIFAQRGIFPFGEESYLRTDMYHQYAPFFSEFRHKLTTGGSLLYSWDIGMGVNFAALYAYYLASPVNWLVALCPQGLVIEFMTYMIVLKTGLCGLSFAWYLQKHNRMDRFGAGYFGVFYALSGYMAAYSWNIMWLDCILLFPLIMLGLERLVHEKKGYFYCIMLGLSILSNYYISIMICMFMVLYFICLLFLEGRKGWKDYAVITFQFAGYSLLAGALSAAVLLPEIAALKATASGDFNFPKAFEMYFPIFDMLARHIANVEPEIGLGHWPNIYCGVAIFPLFLLYLANNRIPLKEKIVYCGLLLLFFASFSINVFNFVWHGFHYPNSLPCRQSFIYIFLMLALCFRAYLFLEQTPKKHIAMAFWGSVCYILLAQKLVTGEDYHFAVFYVAILFLAAYTGLMYYYQNPRCLGTLAALLTLAATAVEAAVNTTVTSVTITSREAYVKDNEDVRLLTGNLREYGEFYRIDKTNARTKNDGAWMNFPSVSLFSSVASADMTEFFKRMGCEGSTNAYSIMGSTPFVDSLLGIRYALCEGKQENTRRSLNSFSGETYLYENPYTLPVGFMMPDIIADGWHLDLANPIDVQNEFASLLGAPDLLVYVPGEESGETFHFTAAHDGEYYIYIGNRQVRTIRLTIGEKTDTIENVKRGFLIETGWLKAGETVRVENKDGPEILDAGAYLFKEDGLAAVYEKLNQNPFVTEEWEDTLLRGSVDAGQGGVLFFSVPYDAGWEIRVDGEEAPARKMLDAFMGVELTEGMHSVEMSYRPKGLWQGVVISAGALAWAVLIAVFGRAKKYKRRDERTAGGTPAPGSGSDRTALSLSEKRSGH